MQTKTLGAEQLQDLKKPDPSACAIDAFTLDWSVYKLVYRFPHSVSLEKYFRRSH